MLWVYAGEEGTECGPCEEKQLCWLLLPRPGRCYVLVFGDGVLCGGGGVEVRCCQDEDAQVRVDWDDDHDDDIDQYGDDDTGDDIHENSDDEDSGSDDDDDVCRRRCLGENTEVMGGGGGGGDKVNSFMNICECSDAHYTIIVYITVIYVDSGSRSIGRERGVKRVLASRQKADDVHDDDIDQYGDDDTGDDIHENSDDEDGGSNDDDDDDDDVQVKALRWEVANTKTTVS